LALLARERVVVVVVEMKVVVREVRVVVGEVRAQPMARSKRLEIGKRTLVESTR
jgi:hypothetical protein